MCQTVGKLAGNYWGEILKTNFAKKKKIFLIEDILYLNKAIQFPHKFKLKI